MSPRTKREPIGQRRVGADGVEVRFVARVGELVEDRDGRPVAPGQDVADVAGADEPGSARDQQPPEGAVRHAIGQPTGRVTGGARRPSASSADASSAARRSDGTVPASVQWPS